MEVRCDNYVYLWGSIHREGYGYAWWESLPPKLGGRMNEGLTSIRGRDGPSGG